MVAGGGTKIIQGFKHQRYYHCYDDLICMYIARVCIKYMHVAYDTVSYYDILQCISQWINNRHVLSMPVVVQECDHYCYASHDAIYETA